MQRKFRTSTHWQFLLARIKPDAKGVLAPNREK